MTCTPGERSALSEMPLVQLWELFPIVLCEHNDEYAQWYEEQRDALTALLGSSLSRISHIGSTAVPGLLAKPTVDILAELNPGAQPTAAVAALTAADWLVQSAECGPPCKVVLGKGYTPDGFADRVYHLHLRPLGDWPEPYFRDYLIEHPETAALYAQLKRSLAVQFKHDRDGYTNAKSNLVERVTTQARTAYAGRYAVGAAVHSDVPN